MNRISVFALLLFVWFSAVGAIPSTVQGRPYRASRANFSPGPVESPDFDLSTVQFWAGEGSNRCAVVIQWNEAGEQSASVFGFRWDGSATGEDALVAVVKAHPCLYGSFSQSTYGVTINGLGWDPDGDGGYSLVCDGTTYWPDADGVFSLTAEQCDNTVAGNVNDWFRGGWYEGYWSYWTRDEQSGEMGYSQVGASGRELVDGCVDGWMFAPGLETGEWKKWTIVPGTGTPTEPDPVDPENPDKPVTDYIKFNITSDVEGDRTAEVTFATTPTGSDFWGNLEFYKGDIEVPATVAINGNKYTVTAVGKNAFRNATSLTSVTLPSTVTSIGDYAFSDCSSLHLVNIPDGVTVIPECAFHQCKSLEAVKGCAGITVIGESSFMMCESLRKVEGLELTEVIERFAFCSDPLLEDLAVMPALRSVGDNAFAECNSVRNIVLPQTVGENAIGEIFGCKKSGSVTLWSCSPTPPELLGVYNLCVRYTDDNDETNPLYAPVYVPFGCSAAYRKDITWGRSAIMELTPDYYLTDDAAEVDEDGDLVFGILVDSDYFVKEDDVPELFLEANDFDAMLARKARLMRVEYRVKGASTSKKLIASTDGNRAFATLLSPAPGVYQYRWVNTEDDELLMTEWTDITVEDDSPADPTGASFMFESPYTLDPKPADDDWVKTDASTNEWDVAGITFTDNGVTLVAADGTDKTYVRKSLTSITKYEGLVLYGSMTLTAPEGYIFRSVRMESNVDRSMFLGTLNLLEDTPGTLTHNKTQMPYGVTWTADDAKPASRLVMKPTSSSYIARMEIELAEYDDQAGTDEVVVDSEDAVYYNLQGMPVSDPAPGLYIMRTSSGARKVYVR